jgi:hypothetical protein
VANLFFAGIRVSGQKIDGGEDHTRRAEAALEAMLFPERGLERVKGIHRPNAFYGSDRLPLTLDGKLGAAFHCQPIDQHGTRPALAGITADVGSGQIEVVT